MRRAARAPMLRAARRCSTPSASSTSALPHALDAARLPCLATGTPQPATMNAAAVEMLIVCALSPPVPTMSSTIGSPCSTRTLRSRIARAAPTTSSTVSPFAASAASSAAARTGESVSSMIAPISVAPSRRAERSSPPSTRRSNGGILASFIACASHDVLRQGRPFARQHRLGMELHAARSAARGARALGSRRLRSPRSRAAPPETRRDRRPANGSASR